MKIIQNYFVCYKILCTFAKNFKRMENYVHKWGYWTKERCAQEALKYETKTAFKLGSPGAHTAAYHHGWLGELCSHMRIRVTHYTKNECALEALKYETKTEFMKKSPVYYSHAIRKGFINEICGHMKKMGNPEKRIIYAFEFHDKHVYIGLTSNVNRRKKEHLNDKDSAVYKHITTAHCKYIFKALTGYLPKEEAALIEDETIIDYSRKGWILLNKKRGGDLGGKTHKYTKRLCREIALLYNDKTLFRETNKYFYNYISKRGWIEELCSHMIQHKMKNGYWTKERCAEEASKYKKRIDFQKKCPSAYSSAFKNGWLDEICSHMSYNEYKPIKWTKDNCMYEAKLCESRGEFKKKCPAGYKAAMANGWLDDIFINHPNHGYKNNRVMIAMTNNNGKHNLKYWTEERIIKEAYKYSSLSDFARRCSGGYDAACSMGIMDRIRKILAPDFVRWSYEMLNKEAKKYETKKDFRKGAIRAYNVASKRGLLDDICSHMK